MISEGLEPRLQSLAPSDGFITYLKITSLAGIALASPWIFYHLWRFVAAGLYTEEKRLVHLAAPLSVILFVSGAAFFIMFIAPFTLRFFIRFNKVLLGVDSAFTFEKYISFITNMILVFGFAFQTPLAIFFLNRTGIVSLETFTKSRKYVLLIVFILAAILTPGPDVISQVALAIPLYLLFEAGILLGRFFNFK
jgi:sec-independent protein translocase protein TatC